jgi:hypothetical protein
MLIGLRTEDADASVVRLLKRPRVVLHVLQQVKHGAVRLIEPKLAYILCSYCF